MSDLGEASCVNCVNSGASVGLFLFVAALLVGGYLLYMVMKAKFDHKQGVRAPSPLDQEPH